MTVENSLVATVKRHDMLPAGCRVVVGVSGGADSLTLLHLLVSLRERLGLAGVEVCHLHHGIRGQEADRDMAATEAFCREYGVICHLRRADVPALAKASGKSQETVGREERYRFFDETADAIAAREGLSPTLVRIATAHNRNDHAETLLLNLIRGTSPEGLGGIPPMRGRIVRPLLEVSRAEIEQYCADHAIPYVNDSTNAGDDYRRNRIRHQLLPLLLEENPRFLEAAYRLSESLRQDCRYLREQAETLLAAARLSAAEFGGMTVLDRKTLADAPGCLRDRVCAALIRDCGGTVTGSKVRALSEAILSGTGGMTAAPGCTWVVRPSCLFLQPPSASEAEREFHAGEAYTSGRWTVIGQEANGKCELSDKFTEKSSKNTIDCDRIIGTLTLRTRLPGDAIRLKGRGCTHSLKKLLNQQGLPDRDNLPILADREGPIWVCGIGVAERVCPDADSVRVLLIHAESEQ